MKIEDKMQTVTFVCDACGVKLPVVPPGTSSKTEEQQEFAHFILTVKSGVVVPTHIHMGEGPSHGRHGVSDSKQLDICNGCSKKPLAQIVVEACKRISTEASGG